jgi:hypothetical protein
MPPRLIHRNLPTVFASFIGRQHEIAEILQLLATKYMVSLIGVGPPVQYNQHWFLQSVLRCPHLTV